MAVPGAPCAAVRQIFWACIICSAGGSRGLTTVMGAPVLNGSRNVVFGNILPGAVHRLSRTHLVGRAFANMLPPECIRRASGALAAGGPCVQVRVAQMRTVVRDRGENMGGEGKAVGAAV